MSNLNAERGPIHVHVGATILVEGAAPAYEDLVAHVEQRLNLVPRFRQKIVKIPLGIENPVWGDDPSFDVRRHVRHVSVPDPGAWTSSATSSGGSCPSRSTWSAPCGSST
jgi:diacylglycerol O-acyltransferase